MDNVADVLQIVGFSAGALAAGAKFFEWRLQKLVAKAVEEALKR